MTRIFVLILILASNLFWTNGGRASEVDPYTFGHVALENSADEINALLERFLAETIRAVNDALRADVNRTPLTYSDTHVEWLFFKIMADFYIRDVAYGVLEKCISANECEGGGHIERILVRPEESVYSEAKWRYTPARHYLASVINVCGVRMGTDKLTHLIDDGFHYYNATRIEWAKLSVEEVRDLSIAFEKAVMGAKLTGVVSYADIEANVRGVDFYYDLFHGSSSYIKRTGAGFLEMESAPDICDYVNRMFDERILENEYVFARRNGPISARKRAALFTVIDERLEQTEAAQLTPEELERERNVLLARSVPEPDWKADYPKWRVAWSAMGFLSDFAWKRDFRRAALAFRTKRYFSRRGLNRRKEITIRR